MFLKGEYAMGNPVVLTPEQSALRDELLTINKKIWLIIKKETRVSDYNETLTLYKEMAEKAHELHMSLVASGHEPKHHKYMLENRGVPVDTVEFYNHIHPVDDLLSYINDVNANDDPEDTTIGKKFVLKIYTRRWGHYDTYYMVRTEEGWTFTGTMISNSGECNKTGSPCLYDALRHDSVCYPKQLDEFIEYLWEQASDGLTEAEVQECFDMLGEWISSCEMNTPRGIFGGLI